MCAKKITDAGEELRANRRKSTPIISAADFVAMNATLQKRIGTKKELWPQPDYHRMVHKGCSRQVARVLKEVYDCIPRQPHAKSDPKDYVHAIYLLRQSMEGWVESASCAEYLKIDSDSVTDDGSQGLDKSLFNGMVGAIRAVIPTGEAGVAIKKTGLYGFGNELDPGIDEFFTSASFNRIVRDLKAGWPARTPLWKKCGFCIVERSQVRLNGNYTLLSANIIPSETMCWINFSDDNIKQFESKAECEAVYNSLKSFVVTGPDGYLKSFDTEDEAVEAALRKCRKPNNERRWEPPALTPDEVIRIGEPIAVPAPLSSEYVATEFNLRGLNYGNWVTNSERMWHLSNIHSALVDLSLVLGVDNKWISRDKELGIAVGAQGGIGNGAAVAHFVPGINDVNITKVHGPGSLAHEYGHFLDHMISVAMEEATERHEFASSRLMIDPRDTKYKVVRGLSLPKTRSDTPEIREINTASLSGIALAMANVLNALNYRFESEKEYQERLSGFIASARTSLLEIVKDIDAFETDDFDDVQKKTYAKHLVTCLSEYGITHKGDADRVAMFSMGHIHYVPTIGDMVLQFRTIAFDLRLSLHDIESLGKDVACMANPTRDWHSKEIKPTTFYGNAVALDGHKAKTRYWTKPEELFARAFSDFVFFKLQQSGRQNLYLVRDYVKAYAQGVEERKVAAIPHLQGDELLAVVPYMEELVREAIRLFDDRIGARNFQTNQEEVAETA